MSVSPSLLRQVDAKLIRSTRQPTDYTARLQEESLNAAWQHEMERAQFENWFKPFDAGTPSQRDSGRLQATHERGKSLAGLINPRPHRVSILQGSDSASPDTNSRIGINTGEQQRAPMVDSTADQVVHLGDSGGIRTPADVEKEVRSLPSAPTAENMLGAAGRIQSSALQHAQNSTATHAVDAPASPRHLQIALPSAVHALPDVSSSLDMLLTTKAPALQEAAEEKEPDEPVKSASTARVQGASMSPENTASPVRLHVQWQGQSASIWLGMDGSAAQVSSQVHIVVAELRRHFSATGQRIGHIVCNGSVVFDGQSGILAQRNSQFAVQVDAQLKVQPRTNPNVNSAPSELPIHNPQEKI